MPPISTGRRYQEYEWNGAKLYVWVQDKSAGKAVNSVEHMVIVKDGQSTILTSFTEKTIPDVIRLTEASIK